MKHFRNVLGFLALAALFVAIPQCRADEWDKKTVITVDEAIQLPKVVLQPGTYVFKLLKSDSDRHIVQVFDKDEKHVITTILAIPNRRITPTGKTVFTFWEAPAGQPAPVRAWFYPGDNFGQEFAYPKHMSTQIAANSKAMVVTTEADSAEDMKTAPVTNTTQTGETSATVTTAEATPPPPPPAAETQPAQPVTAAVETQPAQPLTTAAATPAPEPQASPVPAQLPKTASQLPLVGLLGMIALAGSILARPRRRA